MHDIERFELTRQLPTTPSSSGNGRAFSVAGLLAGAFAVAIVAGVAVGITMNRLPAPAANPDGANLRFALTRAVEAFRCPTGMTRLALVRGVEDGFSPSGHEPASIDPRLLRSGYYSGLAARTSPANWLRDYDAGGVDGTLLDHFAVPPGVVSGTLLLRIRPAGDGARNDGLLIGDLDPFIDPRVPRRGHSFGSDGLLVDAGATRLPDDSVLWSRDIRALSSLDRQAVGTDTLADYLARTDRPADVNISIADDTVVDALALLVCHVPSEARGVTLVENRFKRLGPELSWLSCGRDQSQSQCNPRTGDQSCSLPSPVACYRDGTRVAPQGLWEKGIAPTSFVAGEVRMSAPVRGDSFPHLGDANAFCQAQFGRQWRVLSYHEGGGGNVASFSRIAPLSRGLVNIRDQQYANCWDRGMSR